MGVGRTLVFLCPSTNAGCCRDGGPGPIPPESQKGIHIVVPQVTNQAGRRSFGTPTM